MIGQIVTKWQPFFKIQDGGDCFKSPNVFTNFGDDRSNTKEQFFEIQDGGSHHLEKYTSQEMNPSL